MGIQVSDIAAQQIQEQLTQRGKGLGIRIRIKTTGCSGLAYVLEFADEVDSEDLVFIVNDRAKLIVDPKSYTYVNGTEITYVKNGLNEGFEFNNPNVRAECGCGESFSL